MLMMRPACSRPSRSSAWQKIERHYSEIGSIPEGALRIGAKASLSPIGNSPPKRCAVWVMSERCARFPSAGQECRAHGGALAHGDPHMDLPPLFAALGARVSVTGQGGTREIAVEDLYGRLLRDDAGKERTDRRSDRAPLTARRRPYEGDLAPADDWPALILATLETDGQPRFGGPVSSSRRDRKGHAVEDTERVLTGAAVNDALLSARAMPLTGESHSSRCAWLCRL